MQIKTGFVVMAIQTVKDSLNRHPEQPHQNQQKDVYDAPKTQEAEIRKVIIDGEELEVPKISIRV